MATEPSPKVGIVGAGRMGVSLAHLNSGIGLETVVKVRPNAAAQARARDALAGSYAREVARGHHTEAEAAAALERVRITGDFADLAGCDVVIESVYEETGPKREVLAAVQEVLGPQGVCASATSSIPAAMLAEGMRCPSRVIVTHYIWPAHRTRLVEMAVPSFADADAVRRIHDLLARQGKTAITVQDRPGLLTTRVLTAYWSEVLYLVREGASPDRIDAALEAFGWPMGPCRMIDTVGALGLIPSGYHFLRPYLGERIDGLALVEPAVTTGHIDRRAGQGFYIRAGDAWTANEAMLALLRVPGRGVPGDEEIVERTMGMIVCEAMHALAEGVARDWETVAFAVDNAFAFPRRQGGLLGYVDRIGREAWRARLARFARLYGPRFRAPGSDRAASIGASPSFAGHSLARNAR